ncbi:MAG: hypothetical protein NC400_15055 [Clostridium sp.]|nr:hypothetical protein [Clostridium sp.]
MTAMQERAFEMISRLPEDKVYYVVRLLEGIEGLIPQTTAEVKTTEQGAYENLQRFRKSSSVEIDYRAELSEALEEKYEDID